MPESSYILAAVRISSAMTWTLRAAPFALLAPIRHSADLLPYLSENMPVGIMTILVFYAVRHVPPAFTPVTATPDLRRTLEFAITAHDHTDERAIGRRLASREAHLAGVRQMIKESSFLSGGGILDPSGKMIGSSLHMAFPSRGDLQIP